MTRDDAFDALFEAEPAPELPRLEFGRTLPFVRARVPLEDIYRLSVDAEKPAQLVLKAAHSGPDELAAAMRALDGKPYRGFALLYAAQKGGPLVAVDPRRALALASAIERTPPLFRASISKPGRRPRHPASPSSPRRACCAHRHSCRPASPGDPGRSRQGSRILPRGRGSRFRGGHVRLLRRSDRGLRTRASRRPRASWPGPPLLSPNSARITSWDARRRQPGCSSANKGDYEVALVHLDRAIAALGGPEDALALTGALNNREPCSRSSAVSTRPVRPTRGR